eukprot:SAG31_NODE_5934_length_2251_cov_16.050651_2_plen_217_part_00
MEQHLAEQTRQREHEQMLAQIVRTDRWPISNCFATLYARMMPCCRCRWLDDVCRPVSQTLFAIGEARRAYLFDAVPQLESSNPELVSEMLSMIEQMVAVGPDGIARSKRSGNVHWDPAVATQAKLTHNYGIMSLAARSAAASAIGNSDFVYTMQNPFVALAPQGLLDSISAESQSPIAARYRRYIETTFLPLATEIAKILSSTRASTVEWPSPKWL